LTIAYVAFAVSMLLHNLDHVFQARGIGALSTEVLVSGSLAAILAAVGLVLVLRRDRRAPLFAAVVGFGTAIGVTLGHVAPRWSSFSDPYPDAHLGVYSWVVMFAEIITAFVVGVVALQTLRQRPAAAGAI
jgi:putative exporter of polyketide antibiotics